MRGGEIKIKNKLARESAYISPSTLAQMLDIGRSTASQWWPKWCVELNIEVIRVLGRPRFRLRDIEEKLLPAMKRGEL